MTAGLPPPAIMPPAPYEVSYGLVTGSVAHGTRRIVVRVDRAGGVPAPNSHLDGVLRRALVVSDNDAANQLEAWLGGSTSAGGHDGTDLMTSLGSR